MASAHDLEKSVPRQPCGKSVLARFVWGYIRRDSNWRGNWPKDPPARQVLLRIDLLRLPQIGIPFVLPVGVGVAIIAAGRIHKVAAEADQYPVLARQIEIHWCNLIG